MQVQVACARQPCALTQLLLVSNLSFEDADRAMVSVGD